jgi:hypothetical protein
VEVVENRMHSRSGVDLIGATEAFFDYGHDANS